MHQGMPLQTNGRELRRRRELQAMTLTEFARQSGYSVTHVCQVELGNNNAGPRFLRSAARILACEIADITVHPDHAASDERASA